MSKSNNLLLISILLLLLLSSPAKAKAAAAAETTENNNLASPKPSDFPNPQQYLSYKIIQRFKQSITCDPKNITSTWSSLLPCTYLGFFCETPPGLINTPTIASIDFNTFQLCSSSSLSGFLDSFPDLAIFHANSNSFSGSLPDLSRLPFLYELDLSNNLFSGPFPSNLLSIPNLIFLDIRYNRFSGAVPPSLFSITTGFLFFNNNLFSQNLPADLGETPVSYLTLANNAFAGDIPRSIGDAGDTLREVLFLNNQLSGCLPEEIGMLRYAVVFDAGNNRLTGEIPYSFGCLTEVEQLNLAGNLMYGTVPEVVCRLGRVGRLENLSVAGNYFSWVGSSCWGLIRRGMMDVRRNCIFGLPEQRTPAECGWFYGHQKFCPIQLTVPCSLPFLG